MNELKRKDGFTLIELLAVIVILAIIALIAVPVVMNIIDKAQKSAFKDSAYGILKAGELYYSEQEMSLNVIEEDKVFEFPNNIGTLKLKGDIPQGMMVITKEGKIALAITNGKYCITKNYDEDIKLLENVSRCAIPYTLAAVATTSEELGVTKVEECIKRGTICNFGADVEEPTSFAIEVNDTDLYKFYVINDNGEEVTLIMDKNLYSSTDTNNGNVAWYSGGVNNLGPLTALEILKERTKDWINIKTYTYTLENDDDGLGGRNGYNPFTKDNVIGVEESLVENVRARLPRLEELTIAELGCTTTSGSCKQWLYKNLYGTKDNNTYGYWTSTACSTQLKSAWYVNYHGNIEHLDYRMTNGSNGIRPVITISK